MEASEKDLKAVARGDNPVWEQTYDHPKWGKITFKGKLPTARQLADHTIEMDNMLDDLHGEPRVGTMLLIASLSGLKVLLDLPIVDEKRVEEEERTRIERIYYDPDNETDETFVVQVWTDFTDWRRSFVEKEKELGNSSGTTHGSDLSASSTEPTPSPSTTPDSESGQKQTISASS